jgi:alpha-beta hydrolase superfamily lysophospholipase
LRKPEDSGSAEGEGIYDASFLDRPEITAIVFYPRRTGPTPKVPGRLHPLSFPVDDGINIDGAIHLAEESARNAPNVLFFHGNGETVADYDEIGQLYSERGITFAVVDYRGYGTSGGSPSYSAMTTDAVRIFPQYLDCLAEFGLSGPVFVMGRSLGSSPALDLAVRFGDRISGLILESGFAHTFGLLEKLGADPRSLDGSREKIVSNLEKMKKVILPVLIIHGENDEIIPLTDGQALFKAASHRVREILVIPRAGHNTLLVLGFREYMEAVTRFIERETSKR